MKIFARAKVVNLDYIMIAETLGIDQDMISLPRTKWADGMKHWEANWVWTRFDTALETLGAERLSLPWGPFEKRFENIFKSVSNYFASKYVIELWPTENSALVLASNDKAASICDRFDFDITPLQEQKASWFEITADQFFTTLKPGFWCGLYCMRPHDDLAAMIRAFNSSITFSSPETLWIIEGRLENQHDQSANEMLLAIIQKNYPMLTIFRVRNSHVALVWYRQRHIDFDDRPIPDASAPNYVATLPNASLNEIAEKINSSRKDYKDNFRPQRA